MISDASPIYLISVAAQLADMHPQTLRQYDRMGLVVPRRQGGKHRRYSARDVAQLRQIQSLSKEGVSLEGIRRILDLESELEQLQERVESLQFRVRQLTVAATEPMKQRSRVFVADGTGGVTPFGDRNKVRRLFKDPLPLPAARQRSFLAISAGRSSS